MGTIGPLAPREVSPEAGAPEIPPATPPPPAPEAEPEPGPDAGRLPSPMDIRARLAAGGPLAASARAATAPIPKNTVPHDHPEYWPFEVRSSSLPLKIHYRPGEEATARAVLGLLERAWQAQIRFGFREPPLAPGTDALDVWIWRGSRECYGSWRADNPATEWADAFTYMVIDPEGPHGGDKLRQLVTHELNHIFQATDDWYEFRSAFEGTATFVEWEEAGLDDELLEIARDFQDRPQWSIDRDDGGKSWYTYGYAMYLRFLKDRYAGGDASFAGKAWNLCRNPPGAEDDPSLNNPDFVEGLEKTLPGMTYADSVVGFARWRFYTGKNDDGHHDPDAAKLPEVASQHARLGDPRRTEVRLDPAPQMLGSSYVEVERGPSDPDFVSVSLKAPRREGVRYVVQAVPGLDGSADGEVLDLVNGRARLRFAAGGKRTLIVTAVPAGGAKYDPDTAAAKRYPATVVIERP